MQRLNFIIAGQSNASGRGSLSTVPTYANGSQIFNYSNAGVWETAHEPIDESSGQQDGTSDEENLEGAGFAMAFADHLIELFRADGVDIEVGLIPCAKGNTAIKQWRRMPTRKNLFGSMIARADASREQGQLAGLLWWQGETDAENESLATGHREAFGNLVADIRVDLQDLGLPVAFARLNNLNPAGKPYWNTIRSMQNEIYIPKCALVSTDGVPYDSIKVHATTEGYQTIGVRFADAMYSLLNN